MTKKDLRVKYKALRNQLSAEEVDSKSLEIVNHLLKLPIWDRNCFHIFLPIAAHNEINTEYILHLLSGKDKNIIIPKSSFKYRTMKHFLLTDNTKILLNEFGIPEPEDGIEVATNKIEVVFVPLLAYDKKGHRVGYGKGFYDKFLSECTSDTIKIGLSVFAAEEYISDASTTDIKMNYCVTPEEVHAF